MKRKNSNTTDLRSFIERAAARKKQSQPEVQQEVEGVIRSTNESCMQLVVFEGQDDSGTGTSAIPPEPEAVTVEPTVIEEDEAVPLNESNSSDEDTDDMYHIQHDPGLRVPISTYDVNDQDSVRRAYIALGPCRPKMKQNNFPQHECGGMRRFNRKWFNEFKWLEYSVEKDAAYCFVCYLFKDSNKFAGGDAFIDEGWRNCNLKSRLYRHAGAINSAHSEV
jgi:hypothetical protein